jgi:hypothetical protein
VADAFEITSVAFEPGEDSGSSKPEDPFPFIPTRDTALASAAEPAAAPAAAASPEPSLAPAAPASAFSIDAPTAPLTLVAPLPPAPATESVPPPRAEAVPAPAPPAAEMAAAFATPAPATLESAPAPFSTDAVSGAAPAAAPADESDSAPEIFRSRPEDADAIFGEPPALFQTPEETAAPEAPVETPAPEESAAPSPAAPSGRALADLYYSQGHYAEALQIYDDLVTRHPFDEELMKMRRDAEARLLPAGQAPSAAGADPGVERRRARIRALERWLSRVQAG